MVKSHKVRREQPTTPKKLSAFAVYKAAANDQVCAKVSGPDFSRNNIVQDGNENIVTASSGFIKQISSRSFALRRSLKKKSKKLKKTVDVPAMEDVKSTSKIVGLSSSGGNSSRRSTNVSSDKGAQFVNVREKRFSNQVPLFHMLQDRKTLMNLKSSSRLQYKSSDKSIELSTSHSLTGFEDEFDEPMDDGLPVFDQNLDPNRNKADDKMPKVNSKSTAQHLNEVVSSSKLKEHKGVAKGILKAAGGSMPQKGNVDIPSAPISVRKAIGKVAKMPFPVGNSVEDGKVLFKWLIHPMTDKHFFSTIWEKKPALIKRRAAAYSSGIFGTEDFNKLLHECNVQYGVNLDVTSFQNGIRETHNPEGRVYPAVAWDYYKNGCSLRLKNPQAFSKSIWRLCATLQEYFKNMVGANVYLTPPGTQGFAPHYDDIEAFILQLEGKKHWRLYNPRSSKETLPRYSSGNFLNDDIGNQIFDAVLEPGDLLYFPRGFIHQAQAVPDTHSLHITISTYQRNSWADALNELIPNALAKAIEEDVEFRKGLPIDYTTTMGYQNREYTNQDRRREVLAKVSELIHKIVDYVDVDANADERAKLFLHDALPPVLTQDERTRCIQGASVQLSKQGAPSNCQCDIDMNTQVRIVRKNALRVIRNEECSDDEDYLVFHSIQNPRTYHAEEPKCFSVTHECLPAIEYLIHSYPEYKPVGSMPLTSDEDKVNVICDLLEKGVLLTKSTLQLVDRNCN